MGRSNWRQGGAWIWGEVICMGCDFDGQPLSRQQALMARRRAYGCDRNQVWKRALGSSQIAWSCVEDGIFFGKPRS